MLRRLFLCSPLALFGIGGKKELKDGPHPIPFYGTWKTYAEACLISARLHADESDHWKERALTAEKKLQELMDADELPCRIVQSYSSANSDGIAFEIQTLGRDGKWQN
jgi:hypothetical protein